MIRFFHFIAIAGFCLLGLPLYSPAGPTNIISYIETNEDDTTSGDDKPAPITNEYGMVFVYIPPGEFLMGSPPDESGRQPNERQHKVILSKGFYIMTTEATQKQWAAVMGDNPSAFSDCGPDCPVENVAWEEVDRFIETLNEEAMMIIEKSSEDQPADDLKDQTVDLKDQTDGPEDQTDGPEDETDVSKDETNDPKDQTDDKKKDPPGRLRYSLPTEAQWEYACRAGSQGWFYFGGDILDLSEYAWYKSNAGEQLHSVARKKPNDFGLYDMHGNVWEWCRDFAGPYPKKIKTDPTGKRTGSFRIVRGGSWFYPAIEARSANRLYMPPEAGNYNVGFRLILTSDQIDPE